MKRPFIVCAAIWYKEPVRNVINLFSLGANGFYPHQPKNVDQGIVIGGHDHSQIRIMYKYIQKYNNSNIGNYWITTSGILAMSHLCGPDATIKFLESRGKIVSKDGNNVNITRYLQFNNFNLPIDSILQPNYINIHLMKYLKQ